MEKVYLVVYEDMDDSFVFKAFRSEKSAEKYIDANSYPESWIRKDDLRVETFKLND